jgi:hypothetical protein
MHGPPADNATPLMNLPASRPWAAHPPVTDQRQPPHGHLPRDHHPRRPGATRALTCGYAKLSSALSKISGVLHFIEDHEDPWAIVNCYKVSMAPGSYLVISHVTADHLSAEAARQAKAAYASASAPGIARSREQVAGFFGGLDMVAPGLVDVAGWRPVVIGAPLRPAVFHGGIVCKTHPGRPR